MPIVVCMVEVFASTDGSDVVTSACEYVRENSLRAIVFVVFRLYLYKRNFITSIRISSTSRIEYHGR